MIIITSISNQHDHYNPLQVESIATEGEDLDSFEADLTPAAPVEENVDNEEIPEVTK